MRTDYKYTIRLILGIPGLSQSGNKYPVIRFRIRRLEDKKKVERLRGIINKAEQLFNLTDNIDKIDTKLVIFCYRVQRETIGLLPAKITKVAYTDRLIAEGQNIEASICLYKYIYQLSQENNLIFPTEEVYREGISTAAENIRILRER